MKCNTDYKWILAVITFLAGMAAPFVLASCMSMGAAARSRLITYGYKDTAAIGHCGGYFIVGAPDPECEYYRGLALFMTENRRGYKGLSTGTGTDILTLMRDPKFATLPADMQQDISNRACKIAGDEGDEGNPNPCEPDLADAKQACAKAPNAQRVYSAMAERCYSGFLPFLKQQGPLDPAPDEYLARMARIPGADSAVARAQDEHAAWLRGQREAALKAEHERSAAAKAAIFRLEKRYPSTRGMTRDEFVTLITSTEVNALGSPIFSDGRISGKVFTLYTPIAQIANGIAVNQAPYDQINDEFVAWCDCDGRTDIVLKTFGYKMGLAQIGLDRDGSSSARIQPFTPGQDR